MATAMPEVHARALSALHERIRVLSGREDRARKALQSLEQEREKLEAERAALQLVEGIYRRTLGIDVGTSVAEPPVSTGEVGRMRARIGPQRYVMLSALKSAEVALKIDQIAECTFLGYKRVKDQMAADLRIGVVKAVWDSYQLTDVGLDLLSRYEKYKMQRNEPLPSVDEASNGTDTEEDFD